MALQTLKFPTFWIQISAISNKFWLPRVYLVEFAFFSQKKKLPDLFYKMFIMRNKQIFTKNML